MNIDFSTPGNISYDMIPYLKKVIPEFPEKIMEVASTPAADHLFKLCTPTKAHILPESQAIAYHHTTAQLLFLSWVSHDIQTAVAFLTTRVKVPDEDDSGKLKQVLKYLNGTRHLKLTHSADSLSILHWYVDASHQTHDDCRGHTGSIFTFGTRVVTSSLNKHKFNTKSSMESELVAMYDKSGDILLTQHFLEAQKGHTISANIVYQDNMSTLSLEKNGRVFSSKRTKHNKAKYFFIQYYYQLGEINLKYCPTNDMWEDTLTKPLQGNRFCQLCAVLMNCPVNYLEDPPMVNLSILNSLPPNSMKPRIHKIATPPQECVGVTSSPPKNIAKSKSGGNVFPSKKVKWDEASLRVTPSTHSNRRIYQAPAVSE
jgi:hypothetical protein